MQKPIFQPGDIVVWKSLSGYKTYYKINKIENGCYYFNDVKENIDIQNILRIESFQYSDSVFEIRLINEEEKFELL